MATGDDFYGAPRVTGSTAAMAAATQPWDRETQVIAVAIAIGESGDDTNARALTPYEDSRGLWQINTLAHPNYDPARLSNPQYNAKAAYEVSSGGVNWSPWTVYTTGAYQQHLSTARIAVDAALGYYDASGVDPTKPIVDPSWINKIPGVAAAKSAAGTVADVGTAIARTAAWVANPRNLLRVLQIVLGVAGLVVGIVAMMKDTAISTVTKGIA